MPAFARTIGIDYSGAQTPIASLKGLRVYLAEGDGRRWKFRRHRARANTGPARASPNGWWNGWPRIRPRSSASTTAFHSRCAISRRTGSCPIGRASLTISSGTGRPTRITPFVDFVRDGLVGNGAARMGNARWRRLTEERAGGAKSVFHFDVQGSVAKSTHAGIPWLRFIRQRLGARVHFWPFDGWDIPTGRSVIAEVYPVLWSHGFADEGRTGDQHDAFSIAAWLSRADRDGSLAAFLDPDLSPPERTLAEVEGWILGVANSNTRPMTSSAPHQSTSTVVPRPMLITASSGKTKACPECGL